MLSQIIHHNKNLSWLSLICLVLFFTGWVSANETIDPNEISESLDDLRVISKFSNQAEANKLVRSLKKGGQSARIISQSEEIVLKSVSVGLYPDQKEAAAVVRHLKSHNIDAFPFRVQSGEYRVHAGALQHEDHYWNRFEQLLALGYKRIHTALKPVTITHFYVVRELIEDLPDPIQLTPTTTKIKDKVFNTNFLFGRFKGEFDGWKESDKQSSSNYFSAQLSAKTKYKKQWALTYGFRFDALEQSSTTNIQKFELQFLPTYLSYQLPNNEWQFGLIDGRWDNRKKESLSDRISSKILVRHLLDEEVIDRRRPVVGARWQFTQSQYQLDVIANPIFRPAKLPKFGSIWHPVSRSNKAIIGIRPTDNWEELVEKGSFADEKYQIGGVGVRMSQQIGRRTRAISLQYIRLSAPYYKLNPSIQQLIAGGSSVDDALAASSGKTFTPEHPHTAIFSWEEFGKTSHFEVAVLSNTPYTTNTYLMKTGISLEWMMGFIYPTKNKNTHLSSYFTGRRINTNDDILDRKTKFGLKGEIYQYSANRHWKAGASYNIDLDHLGLFLNPKINYEQNKYLNLSLYYQLFTGVDNTDNGYHSGHSIIGLSWQAIF